MSSRYATHWTGEMLVVSQLWAVIGKIVTYERLMFNRINHISMNVCEHALGVLSEKGLKGVQMAPSVP
jgi:hypothetical protein